MLLAGGLLALAFLGGVALAPTLIAPAAAELLGGVTGQFLGNGGPGGPGDLLSAAATYIGIDQTALRNELSSGKSLADVATAHDKTRDGLIAALNQADQQRIAQFVDQKGIRGGPGSGRPFGPGFGPAGIGGDPYAAPASYLGISEDDVKAKVRAGQSLAAVANATAGRNRDGRIQAMVADAKAKIEQARNDGKITADQATQLASRLTDRITRLVDATRGPGLWRGPR